VKKKYHDLIVNMEYRLIMYLLSGQCAELSIFSMKMQ